MENGNTLPVQAVAIVVIAVIVVIVVVIVVIAVIVVIVVIVATVATEKMATRSITKANHNYTFNLHLPRISTSSLKFKNQLFHQILNFLRVHRKIISKTEMIRT